MSDTPQENQMQLTHLDSENKPRMVDVSDKDITHRIATASGSISLNTETIALIKENSIKKGNVLVTAELAGVQAGKQTANLIPLCHTLLLSKVIVDAQLTPKGVTVTSEVKCTGQTGVEMEALTAVSVALLTVYDMCKAVDKSRVISAITLLNKTKQAM